MATTRQPDNPSQLEALLNQAHAFAEAAKRLLADDMLGALLDAMVADATTGAVFGDDAVAREAQRQLVLAVSRVRNTLAFAATWREQQEREEKRAKEFE